MPEQDVKSPDSSRWLSILEQKGRGDQRLAVDERRFEEHRLWQASLQRRDDAIAHLELIRDPEIESSNISPLPEPIPLLGALDDEEVRYSGEIGRWIPQFEYYSPVRRWVAMRMSRVVLFLTGFISVHQRRYNHLVLDKLAATQERLDELVGAVNTLSQRLGAIEGTAPDGVETSDTSELPEDWVLPASAGLNALRGEVHRLQCDVLSQTVEVADLQAERLGRRVRQLDDL